MEVFAIKMKSGNENMYFLKPNRLLVFSVLLLFGKIFAFTMP